jgi:curved DNA-binding protein CbpA
MALLDEPGDLAQTPLAALLLEALNVGATGVLTIVAGGARSQVYLRAGVPVGAQTFAAFRPLGQLLLAERAIDADALARSLGEMARSGRPQGEVLLAMGVVTREQVDHALSEQQAGYVALVAGLAEGRFSFEGRPPPPWTAGVRVAPLRAILQALEAPPARGLVASAIAGVTAPLALAPDCARLGAAFGWSAAEGALVARLPALPDLGAFLADPAVPPDRARAILAALLLLGLASGPGAAEVVAPDAVRHLAASAEAPGPPPAAAGRQQAPAPAADAARERRQRLLARAMEQVGSAPSARPPQPAGKPAAGVLVPGAADAELRAALAAMGARARTPDLFARLGVARTATREEVRGAYFQLARKFHPDRFAGPAFADVRKDVQDLFAALNEAYDVLSDDARRAALLAETGGGSEAAAIDFQKGEACLRTRDLRRARAFYEAAARADPRPEHLAALAWALFSDGDAADKKRARQLLAEALREKRSFRAALVAGLVARAEAQDAAAERHFRAALALDPKSAEAERELRALEAKRARRDRPRD